MGLRNKYLRVFQIGFGMGVRSTTPSWNGENGPTEPGLDDTWELVYRGEITKALEEFVNLLESGEKW